MTHVQRMVETNPSDHVVDTSTLVECISLLRLRPGLHRLRRRLPG